MKTGKTILIICFILAGTAAQAQLAPFYSATNNKYGYKDGAGKIVVEPRYDLAYPFTEGIAAVRLAGKYGYLDGRGKEIVAPKYDFTWHFIGGFAAVKLVDKFGFIDKTGREVIPLIYEEANNYHGNCCYKGMAHVKENGKWRIIKLQE
ncbi:MAG: WG repeat-containing protein [Prolixibacteraceae bacterium]|nr:WG repeat-containing protein [Prolixibacteraceae bacterium]